MADQQPGTATVLRVVRDGGATEADWQKFTRHVHKVCREEARNCGVFPQAAADLAQEWLQEWLSPEVPRSRPFEKWEPKKGRCQGFWNWLRRCARNSAADLKRLEPKDAIRGVGGTDHQMILVEEGKTVACGPLSEVIRQEQQAASLGELSSAVVQPADHAALNSLRNLSGRARAEALRVVREVAQHLLPSVRRDLLEYLSLCRPDLPEHVRCCWLSADDPGPELTEALSHLPAEALYGMCRRIPAEVLIDAVRRVPPQALHPVVQYGVKHLRDLLKRMKAKTTRVVRAAMLSYILTAPGREGKSLLDRLLTYAEQMRSESCSAAVVSDIKKRFATSWPAYLLFDVVGYRAEEVAKLLHETPTVIYRRKRLVGEELLRQTGADDGRR